MIRFVKRRIWWVLVGLVVLAAWLSGLIFSLRWIACNRDPMYRDGKKIAALGSGTETYQNELPESGPDTDAMEAYNSSGSSQ